MKRNITLPGIAAIAATLLLSACSKKESAGPATTTTTTTTTTDTSTLKGSAGGFYFGFALTYSLMTNGSAFATTAKGQVNQATFGNEMKYGSIVQNDGSLNFTTADAFLTLCNNSGIQVYGHCLCWHAQQNTNYLNSLTVGATVSANNLVLNGSFESGLNTNWFYYLR